MPHRVAPRYPAVFSIVAVLFALSSPTFASDWQKKVPAADRAQTNPLASDASAADAGGKIYAAKCAKCHGADGEGEGSHPAMRSSQMQGMTPGEVEWIIAHGSRMHGMPAFGSLPENERWQLVSYIQSLNAKPAQ